jgi:hypothetical protein
MSWHPPWQTLCASPKSNPPKNCITAIIPVSENATVVRPQKKEGERVQNHLSNSFLEKDMPDFEIIENSKLTRTDLRKVNLALLINRNDHSAAVKSQLQHPRFMLTELRTKLKLKLVLADSENRTDVDVGILLSRLLLGVFVEIQTLLVTAHQEIIV